MSDSKLVPLHFHFARNAEFNERGFLENWRRKRQEYPSAGYVKTAIAAIDAMAIKLPHVVISLPSEMLSAGAFPKIDRAPDKPNARICISATEKKGTTMGMQELSNESYVETWELCISYEQAVQIMECAHMHANKPYNHPLHMTFFLPTAPTGKEFFCTQYIVVCLQAGGLLEGCNPSAMTGDALLAILRRFYNVSPKFRPAETRAAVTGSPPLLIIG